MISTGSFRHSLWASALGSCLLLTSQSLAAAESPVAESPEEATQPAAESAVAEQLEAGSAVAEQLAAELAAIEAAQAGDAVKADATAAPTEADGEADGEAASESEEDRALKEQRRAMIELRRQVEALTLQLKLNELQQQAAANEAQQRMGAQRLTLEEQQLQRQLAESARKAALREERDALADLQRQQAKAELQLKLSRHRLELDRMTERQQLHPQRQELEIGRLELETLQLAQQLEKISAEKRAAEIGLVQMENQFELAQLAHQRQLHEAAIAIRQAELARQSLIESDVTYAKDPVKDGVLTLSDRQIPLNGPIMTGTADYIVDRLAFFNNQDPDAPIFMMIDQCPGGSLMQGDRIIRAMKASSAPIYVVVTNFAASMAAVILAEADHSLVFNNAIVLHHQPSSGLGGNLAQQREWVDTFQQWAVRLHTSTADRMGITLDQFYEQMYENAVTGDWQAFGDEAVAFKWADAVIDQIIDQGIRSRPTDQEPWKDYVKRWAQGELAGQSGPGTQPAQTAIPLPPLAPFDGYFLYNPMKTYRLP